MSSPFDQGGAGVVQNFYSPIPATSTQLAQIGAAATAGIAGQGARVSPREQIRCLTSSAPSPSAAVAAPSSCSTWSSSTSPASRSSRSATACASRPPHPPTIDTPMNTPLRRCHDRRSEPRQRLCGRALDHPGLEPRTPAPGTSRACWSSLTDRCSGAYLEWRPDGVGHSTYFEIRGTGDRVPRSRWLQFIHNYSLYCELTSVRAAGADGPDGRLRRLRAGRRALGLQLRRGRCCEPGARPARPQRSAPARRARPTASIHTRRGHAVLEGQRTAHFYATTLTGMVAGVMARRQPTDPSTYLAAYMDQDGTRLDVDVVLAGSTFMRASAGDRVARSRAPTSGCDLRDQGADGAGRPVRSRRPRRPGRVATRDNRCIC